MRVKTGTLAELVLGAASVDMIDVALIGAPAKITPHSTRQMPSVLPDQPLPRPHSPDQSSPRMCVT